MTSDLHDVRMQRALLALDGLSVGDAFGQCFFALWCAARHFDNYAQALWTTVSGGGDMDTTCAIVGGIVALSASDGAIPPDWLRAREPLPLGFLNH